MFYFFSWSKMNDTMRIYITPFTKHFICKWEELINEWIMMKKVRMKEGEWVVDGMYTSDFGGSFSFYIPKPQSLASRSDLELSIRYWIFLSLNPVFYYTNCFVYVFEQYGVPSDKITDIISYLVSIYIKIKDIGYLGKLLKLGFIIYLSG